MPLHRQPGFSDRHRPHPQPKVLQLGWEPSFATAHRRAVDPEAPDWKQGLSELYVGSLRILI